MSGFQLLPHMDVSSTPMKVFEQWEREQKVPYTWRTISMLSRQLQNIEHHRILDK